MKKSRNKVEFEEPVMVAGVAVYGGTNGNHLVVTIPENMGTESLYKWKEKHQEKLTEITKCE